MIAWFKSLLLKLWPGSGDGHGRASEEPLDPDLSEIFFAELGEVTQSLRAACATLRNAPTDHEALKQLRRGFHTLKGSAPLIGAAALGDFCARMELLMTRLLETPSKTTPETIGTIERAVALLPDFAQSVRDARPPPPQARILIERVKRLT